MSGPLLDNNYNSIEQPSLDQMAQELKAAGWSESQLRTWHLPTQNPPWFLIHHAYAEMQRRQAAQCLTMARHQPCGCVVCHCEDEVRCNGCGAKNCGTHPLGMFPNPIYETTAQAAPPKAETVRGDTCPWCGEDVSDSPEEDFPPDPITGPEVYPTECGACGQLVTVTSWAIVKMKVEKRDDGKPLVEVTADREDEK